MSRSVGRPWAGGAYLRALAAWALSAFVLLLVLSWILSVTGCGSTVLGYLSSAISFCAALFSGLVFCRERQGRETAASLVLALVLVVLLLSLGILIGDKALDPSGILSVVTFTFAGVAAGSLLFPGTRKTSRKSPSGSLQRRGKTFRARK